MYAVSAGQMAHSKWFNLKPVVSLNAPAPIESGLTNAADVAAQLHLAGDVRGKLPKFRVVVPGVVHEVSYAAATGVASVSTSRSPFLGVLNRLHHAAGLWPAWGPLKWWGAAVGLVSLATVGLAITGLWMWWARKQDRLIGLVLIGANAVFALLVLVLIRSAGP